PSDSSLWITRRTAKFRRLFMTVRPFVYSAAGALALAALWPQLQATHAQTLTSHPGTQSVALVRVVREATERFHDVKVAEAEGYALASVLVRGGEFGACVPHSVTFPPAPEGVRAPPRREIVIYEPLPNGRLRLIGADYLVLASDWDSKNPAPPE